jgi:hypothetical protein
MTDETAPRRAYFASLSTPDLMVCCTVESERYQAPDLALIRQELARRGVDVDRLAVPTAPTGDILGVAPSVFSGPLPTAWSWWGEGWQLFTRHFGFLAALAGVFTVPLWIVNRALSSTHDRDLSPGLLAQVLFLVAFDSLLAASVFNGLHRRMSEGRGSVGIAIAKGMSCWARVFRESLKAYGLVFGPPLLLFALGQTGNETGWKVLAWLWLFYPGSYFLTRVFWIQPLAICKREERNIFPLSRRYSRGRLPRLYWFLYLGVVVFFAGLLTVAIVKGILPKPVLEPAGGYFAWTMLLILFKTTLLVGYYHVAAHPDAEPQVAEPGALPQPPGLPQQP